MLKVKVGIVEDEMIIALDISEALVKLGYDVTEAVNNYTDALEMIANEKPDILLLDIQLNGCKDGIDLALKVRQDHNIPFIFLTANADMATVERAKSANAHAYLVKPFRKNELYASIEICLHNYAEAQKKEKIPGEGNYVVKDSIFIKQGQYFNKVKLDDILFLESDNHYVKVHTKYNKTLVRSSIQDYLDLIGSEQFFRVHRSYAINVNQVETINTEYLIINGTQIPIGKAYRDQLLGFLKLGQIFTAISRPGILLTGLL